MSDGHAYDSRPVRNRNCLPRMHEKAASSASGLCSSPSVDMQGGDAKDGVRPPEGKRHETVGHAPAPQTKQRTCVPMAHT
jgi:hypothetical protein